MECGNRIDEATSSHNLIHRTFIEGLANDVRPTDEHVSEFVITAPVGVHVLLDDFLLSGHSRVTLLKGEGHTVKECTVENLSAGEAAIRISLALGVCSTNHGEALGRLDPLVNLLNEDWLTFEDWLKAHHLRSTLVNFVQQEDAATLHSVNDRAILPNGFTVHQTETTDEVLLISHSGNVHTEELPLVAGANLLGHGSLTIARQAGDEGRSENPRLNDGFHILEVTPRNIGAKTVRHIRPGRQIELRLRSSLDRLEDGSRCRRSRSRSGCWLSSHRSILAIEFGNIEHTTVQAACLVSSNPRRPGEAVRITKFIDNSDNIGAIQRRGVTCG